MPEEESSEDDFYSKIPVELNMGELLLDDHVKKGQGERPAIHYLDRTFTYSWLKDNANKAANALEYLGLEIENRFMILLHDSPEFVVSFLAGLRMGAVPVLVNTMLTPDDYRFMLDDSRAKILITNAELCEKVRQIRDHVHYLKHIILVQKEKEDASKLCDHSDVHLWNNLLAPAKKTHDVARTYKNDVALWLYSSGTTGKPKGTVHLHHDILTTTDIYAKPILNINEESRCLSASKLFFAYGLGNGLTFPLRWGGATVLYPDRPTPDAMFRCIREYRPTHFFGVPTLFAAMLASKDAAKNDVSSLDYIVSAGEALQPAIFERWKAAFNQEILEGIGSTELLHIFISNRKGEARAGSSGKVVPGYEAEIVDDQGNEVPDGTVGNLLVKGESMAVLYWGRHKKSAKVMLGEWLATGDMYSRDKEGFYYYQGRGDDMLKVGGMWVSPVEVENAIMELPEVYECAVVGRPDDDGLVKPKAFVVLTSGHKGDEALTKRIQEHIKTRLAPYKYPRWVEYLHELPKTSTGKIQRHKLRLV